MVLMHVAGTPAGNFICRPASLPVAAGTALMMLPGESSSPCSAAARLRLAYLRVSAARLPQSISAWTARVMLSRSSRCPVCEMKHVGTRKRGSFGSVSEKTRTRLDVHRRKTSDPKRLAKHRVARPTVVPGSTLRMNIKGAGTMAGVSKLRTWYTDTI